MTSDDPSQRGCWEGGESICYSHAAVAANGSPWWFIGEEVYFRFLNSYADLVHFTNKKVQYAEMGI